MKYQMSPRKAILIAYEINKGASKLLKESIESNSLNDKNVEEIEHEKSLEVSKLINDILNKHSIET